MGVWKHIILFQSIIWKDELRSQNSFDGSVTKRKENSHLAKCYISFFLNSSISSKQVFRAVSDFGDKKEKKLSWNVRLPVQVPPPNPNKDQIPRPWYVFPSNFHKTQTTEMKLDFSESECFYGLMEFRILTFCFSYLTYCFNNFGFRFWVFGSDRFRT